MHEGGDWEGDDLVALMAARYYNASPSGFVIMVVGDPLLGFTPNSACNTAALFGFFVT